MAGDSYERPPRTKGLYKSGKERVTTPCETKAFMQHTRSSRSKYHGTKSKTRDYHADVAFADVRNRTKQINRTHARLHTRTTPTPTPTRSHAHPHVDTLRRFIMHAVLCCERRMPVTSQVRQPGQQRVFDQKSQRVHQKMVRDEMCTPGRLLLNAALHRVRRADALA